MKPGRYLASLAGARSVYLLMFEAACALLPPPSEGKDFPLECHKPIREMAETLELGTSTVREALVQLEYHGWISGRRIPRRLGQRVGASYALLADLAAEEVTGERDVVSRLVLHLEPPEPAQTPARKPEPAQDGRGPNRAWDGDEEWTWGTQEGR